MKTSFSRYAICVVLIMMSLTFVYWNYLHAHDTPTRPLSDFVYGQPYLWIWIPSPHSLRHTPKPPADFGQVEAPHHGVSSMTSLPGYLQASLQTLVQQNRRDFRIRLVTDASFHELIPHWNDVVGTIHDELEQKYWRSLAMLQLVYHHGGMVVPASTVALQSFRPTFDDASRKQQCAFFLEQSSPHHKSGLLPDLHIFGAPQRHALIHDLIARMLDAVNDQGWSQQVGNAMMTAGHLAVRSPPPNQRLGITQRAYQIRAALRYCIHQADTSQRTLLAGCLFGTADPRGKPIEFAAWMRAEHDQIHLPTLVGLAVDDHKVQLFREYDYLFRPPLEWIETDTSLYSQALRIGLLPTCRLDIRDEDD